MLVCYECGFSVVPASKFTDARTHLRASTGLSIKGLKPHDARERMTCSARAVGTFKLRNKEGGTDYLTHYNLTIQ